MNQPLRPPVGAISSLQTRINAIERQVKHRRLHQDSRLMAALKGGDITDTDIDALYSIVEIPLRAAALYWGASNCLGSPVSAPPTEMPMMCFGFVLADLDHPEIHGEFQDAWYWEVPVEIRNWSIDPEWDAQIRVRRGLLQRLAKHHGLRSLQAEIPNSDPRKFDRSLLPVLSAEQDTRMATIATELGVGEDERDLTLLIWRTETAVVKHESFARSLDWRGQRWT